MTLNLFTDYSLRVLMYAALPGHERFSLDAVSSAYGISRDHVAKVVQYLVRGGYLNSQRGRGGGISIAKPPSEIRVGTIVRETESNTPLLECFHPPTNGCRLIGRCRLQMVMRKALDAFFAELDEVTLADLTGNPQALLKALAA
jgi:Rrf2 family nitric oxide-sensitive transcriptional repressor